MAPRLRISIGTGLRYGVGDVLPPADQGGLGWLRGVTAVVPPLRSAVTELDEHGRILRGTFAVDRCQTFLLDRTGGEPRVAGWKRIDPVRPSWWVAEASVRGSC